MEDISTYYANMQTIIIFFKRVKSFLLRHLLYLFSLFIRLLIPIKKKQVIFWADSYNHYGCNPKYISEYLADNCHEYSLIWAFNKKIETKNVKNARIVYYGTIEYVIAVNQSEFVITNQRVNSHLALWKKKCGQKYIMTWHGSNPLKMIMGDANKSLKFKKLMLRDSKMCDLMLSDNDWFTSIIRKSFWYDGEVLQMGIPRNDIFFSSERIMKAREKVCNSLKLDVKSPILLYAPTFRDNTDNNPYISEWESIRDILRRKFDKNVQIVVRLHPNMLNTTIEKWLMKDKSIVNATYYDDMQEILCSSDLMITDYSSCMFEISMLHRPCFLYMPDIDTYERDFYLTISQLPFQVAYDMTDLMNNIEKADLKKQIEKQDCFIKETFNPIVEPYASKAVVEWMYSHLS